MSKKDKKDKNLRAANKPEYITGTGQKLWRVHLKQDCQHRICDIHNPPKGLPESDWPTHWRADRGLMERICPCGVGHPTTAHMLFVKEMDEIRGTDNAKWEGIHGCCGCCGDIVKTKKYTPIDCIDCGTTFERRSSTHKRCDECGLKNEKKIAAEQSRKWTANNTEQRKEIDRKKQLLKYGLTQEQYDEMLESQEGVCAICQSPPGDRPLSVDHNHVTGQVRGLLCDSCNLRLLGGHDQNPEIFLRAYEYLLAGNYELPDEFQPYFDGRPLLPNNGASDWEMGRDWSTLLKKLFDEPNRTRNPDLLDWFFSKEELAQNAHMCPPGHCPEPEFFSKEELAQNAHMCPPGHCPEPEWVDHDAPPNGIGPVCKYCHNLIDWDPVDHALDCGRMGTNNGMEG